MIWKTLKLKDVCKEITSGCAAPQGDKYFTNGQHPFVRVADMGKLGKYSKNILKTKDLLNPSGTEKLREFPAGTVLFTKSGASLLLNQRAILKSPMYVVSHIGCMIPNTAITSDWLYYYMRQVDFAHYAHATTLPSIKLTTLKEFEIPVPPLPEQERIVARIEELFSGLDKAVETLITTKQQLAVYRRAVLKEAFSSPCNMVQVSSLCNVVRGGSPRPAGSDKYYNGPIPFLKVADLTRNDGMYLNEFTYTIKPEGLTKTRKVPANTLLLSNSGATLGVPKICTFETTFNDGVAAFLDFDLTQQYLPYHYYFWLSKLPEMRAIDQGAAQPNLNTTIIGEVEIPQHNFEEQKQISNMIEARLSVCDSIEKTVDSVLAQADAMRQSILKQAFEGELI